jgi:hypothetical protein
MAKVLVPGKNLNEVAAWDGEANMLPPGEYVFQVEECAISETSNGNPQLEFDLVVVQGALTDTCDGAKKKHWVVMTENSAGRVRNMIDACGVAMDEDGSFDSDQFVGTSFIAEVFEDSYEKADAANGTTITKQTNKIRKERPVDAGFSDGGTVEAPASEPAAPAAPSKPATSTKPAAQSVAPVVRKPVQPAAAAQPRVASSLPARPGARAPIPGRK